MSEREKEVKEFKEKMIAFKKAFGELTDSWLNLDEEVTHDFNKSYPFDDSFDELYNDVVYWVNTHTNEKVKEEEVKTYAIGVYEIWEQMHRVKAKSFEEACSLIEGSESSILEDQFTFVEFAKDPYRFYSCDAKELL